MRKRRCWRIWRPGWKNYKCQKLLVHSPGVGQIVSILSLGLTHLLQVLNFNQSDFSCLLLVWKKKHQHSLDHLRTRGKSTWVDGIHWPFNWRGKGVGNSRRTRKNDRVNNDAAGQEYLLVYDNCRINILQNIYNIHGYHNHAWVERWCLNLPLLSLTSLKQMMALNFNQILRAYGTKRLLE